MSKTRDYDLKKLSGLSLPGICHNIPKPKKDIEGKLLQSSFLSMSSYQEKVDVSYGPPHFEPHGRLEERDRVTSADISPAKRTTTNAN